MRLIPEANQWYKMLSNIVFMAIFLLTTIKVQWDDTFSAVIPNEWYPYLVALLSILGVFARLIAQGIKPEDVLDHINQHQKDYREPKDAQDSD